MNLATRCPSCGTVFRVVRDQLKVSEGWVRCGRCAEVFNAAERLFELESAALGTAAAPQETSALARAEPVADKARATTMVPAKCSAAWATHSASPSGGGAGTGWLRISVFTPARAAVCAAS